MSKKTQTATITQAQYDALQQAYDFLNARLFGGELPNVLVTLQRHARSYGYFAPDRFAGRSGDKTAHELALNPDIFGDRTDEQIISTLAHEMAHVWQQTHGTPPRRSYHDRQWAAKMKEIGLQPSSTGAPGGAEVGQRVSHYIVAGGRFAQAFAALKAKGFRLDWESTTLSKEAKAKVASKSKFTCPHCDQNAWAKPDAHLICGACYGDDETIVDMLAA